MNENGRGSAPAPSNGHDQPAPDVRSVARSAAAAHGDAPEALLEILHDVQGALGHVPREALAEIAKRINRSRAEVHGTLSFYHDFRRERPSAHVLKICRAESCQSVGCEALVEHLAERHGIRMGMPTADGMLTVEEVYCLGNCALSPAALYDGRLIGRLTEAELDRLVDDAHCAARTGEGVSA